MALTSLGTRDFVNLFTWISYDPVVLNRNAVFALYLRITSPDPGLLYSKFLVRAVNTWRNGETVNTNVLAEFVYDSNSAYFPYTSWTRINQNVATVFEVKREPFYSDLANLSAATVQLQIDPAEQLD